jgi:hypothetical protein
MTIRPDYNAPGKLAYINKVLGYHNIPLTLHRDEGYHTFVFDDGAHLEERIKMIPYTSQQTLGRWVIDAEHAWNSIATRLAA